jgi:predicted ATPase
MSDESCKPSEYALNLPALNDLRSPWRRIFATTRILAKLEFLMFHGCMDAAMVLRQLFDELLKRNTFVAFTSNQPPDDLYQVRRACFPSAG